MKKNYKIYSKSLCLCLGGRHRRTGMEDRRHMSISMCLFYL